ncbi:YhgE/Pip family protein [Furfurilactobacillus curtus]|uniref:Membrane protein n=1 Tax=Furfurilactobacillus curtus TaxID=1746200 RepID=A0ABQ5JM81_9LACO
MSKMKSMSHWVKLGLLTIGLPLGLLAVSLSLVKYEQVHELQHIDVALVDHDKAADFKGKQVAIGSAVQKQLVKNHTVHWHFVTEAKANRELRQGHYLMKLTLPKNFSKNVTSVLNRHPRQSEIQVALSDHNNFASHMITKQVADTIRGNVIQNVQVSYDQALLGVVKQMGSGIKQAHHGTQQLSDGANQLDAGGQKLSQGLRLLADNMVTFKAGSEQLASGIGTYTAGVSQLAVGNNQLAAGLGALNQATGPLGVGVSQLAAGSGQLANGINAYTNGVSAINNGNGQLLAGSAKLRDALAGAAGEINQELAAGQPNLNRINDGIIQVKQGITELNQGVNGSTVNLDEGALKQDLLSVRDAATGAGMQLQTAGTNLGVLNDKVFSTGNSASVASQLTVAGRNLTDIKAMIPALMKNPALLAAMKQDPQLMGQLLSLSSKLTAVGTSVANSGQSLSEGGNAALQMKASLGAAGNSLSGISEPMKDVQNQLEGLSGLAPQIARLKQGINQLADEQQGAPAVLNGAQTAITTLQNGLVTVETALTRQGNSLDTMGAVQAMSQLRDGLKQVADGSNQLATQNGKLTNGAQAVSGGLAQLNDQVPTLTAGVNQLAVGAQQAAAGGQQLTANSDKLNDGAAKLTSGAGQLGQGTNQLNDGAGQLGNGLGQLNGGLGQLNLKLADGSRQLQTINGGSGNVKQMVTPISNQMQHDALNGPLVSVFAPMLALFISFIGALIIVVADRRRSATSDQALGMRWLKITGLIVLQAVGTVLVLKLMGATLANIMVTIVLLILSGLAFTVINELLFRWLHVWGLLLTGLLLFLQLIISGGLLPNAMLSTMYQLLAKGLPGTYLLQGLAYSINGLAVNISSSILMLVGFIIIFGLGLLLTFNHDRVTEPEAVQD